MRIFASLFLGFLVLASFSNACCFCCGGDSSDDDSEEDYYTIDRRGSVQNLPTSALLSDPSDNFPVLYGASSVQQPPQRVTSFVQSIDGEEDFFVGAGNNHRFEGWGPHPGDVADALRDDTALTKSPETPSYQNQLFTVPLVVVPPKKRPWYKRLFNFAKG